MHTRPCAPPLPTFRAFSTPPLSPRLRSSRASVEIRPARWEEKIVFSWSHVAYQSLIMPVVRGSNTSGKKRTTRGQRPIRNLRDAARGIDVVLGWWAAGAGPTRSRLDNCFAAGEEWTARKVNDTRPVETHTVEYHFVAPRLNVWQRDTSFFLYTFDLKFSFQIEIETWLIDLVKSNFTLFVLIRRISWNSYTYAYEFHSYFNFTYETVF